MYTTMRGRNSDLFSPTIGASAGSAFQMSAQTPSRKVTYTNHGIPEVEEMDLGSEGQQSPVKTAYYTTIGGGEESALFREHQDENQYYSSGPDPNYTKKLICNFMIQIISNEQLIAQKKL